MKQFTFDDVEEVAEILTGGGLVAFPTETVYGIGCRFDRKESFDRLVKVKRRPADKPFTMMLGEVAKIGEYAYVTPKQQKLIEKFMPGEVTFIFKRKDTVPDFAALNGPTIGIRIPAHPGLLKLLRTVDIPLLVPSANRSGEKPCSSAEEVNRVFGDELDGVIAAPTGDAIPSTVVLLTGADPVVLRAGKVTREEIEKVWKEAR